MVGFFEIAVQFYPQILMGFACSAAMCWLIIARFSKFPHARFMIADTEAKQAVHLMPTPRIGGLAVVMSFVVLVGFKWAQLQTDLLAPLLAAAIVCLVGAKEDFYRNVSAKSRLLAAFFSAGGAIYFSGSMITHLDLPGESALLGIVGIWVIVTLIWSAGTCHALNLIDGLNGLSSGYAMIALIALSLIATEVGEPEIVMIALTLVGAILGFYVFNWPFGKIFLGDAGAYTLGHILAWLGIVLSARHPELSPLALIMILFWPVADTVFTVVRRAIYKRAIGQPDRFHFHHLVVRIVARLANGRLSKNLVNSLSALIMYPIMLAPALLGVAFWNKPLHALVALLVCIIAFMASYIIALGLLAARKLRQRKSKPIPQIEDLRPSFERSQYSGIFIAESLAVDIVIKRQNATSKWTLEAIADQAPGRSWTETFKTDLDAWDAFMKTIERDGIEAIVGFPSKPGRALYDSARFN